MSKGISETLMMMFLVTSAHFLLPEHDWKFKLMLHLLIYDLDVHTSMNLDARLHHCEYLEAQLFYVVKTIYCCFVHYLNWSYIYVHLKVKTVYKCAFIWKTFPPCTRINVNCFRLWQKYHSEGMTFNSSFL